MGEVVEQRGEFLVGARLRFGAHHGAHGQLFVASGETRMHAQPPPGGV
jgi:hypothetical protein